MPKPLGGARDRAYAEVIGDPIAHSLSPLIHGRWIEALGLEADYRRTLVAGADLAGYLAARRADPDWRGCSVTAPHKVAIIPLLDRLTPAAERIGAVNCVFREGGALVGDNKDFDGIAAALGSADLAGRKAVIIGAGGAAAPAVDYLLEREGSEIVLLVRDPSKAAHLIGRAPDRIRAEPMGSAAAAIAGAAAIINATPLGMNGAPPVPRSVLDGLATAAAGATVLDMVYRPEKTPLLAAAETAGLHPVGGLAMLVGQARPAFARFFGLAAPADDDQELRHAVGLGA